MYFTLVRKTTIISESDIVPNLVNLVGKTITFNKEMLSFNRFRGLELSDATTRRAQDVLRLVTFQWRHRWITASPWWADQASAPTSSVVSANNFRAESVERVAGFAVGALRRDSSIGGWDVSACPCSRDDEADWEERHFESWKTFIPNYCITESVKKVKGYVGNLLIPVS